MTESNEGNAISQRKYSLDFLQEAPMIDYRPMDSYIDSKEKLMAEQSAYFADPERDIKDFLQNLFISLLLNLTCLCSWCN